jgi:peptide/nickel transport system permease protein
MLAFIIRRLLLFFPMLFLLSVVSFAIILAPPGNYIDDYVAAMQEYGEGGGKATYDALTQRYGLDKSPFEQYLKWIWGILHWDLGTSLEWNQPVTELVNNRLAMTVTLTGLTLVFTWTLAIPIGIISAVKQYSIIDYVFTVLSYFGRGTPNFLLALVMLWVALEYMGVSITGLHSRDYIEEPWSFGKVIDLLKHLWIPMIILGTDGTAGLTRIVRANLLDEMNKPYVETARAKGMSEWKVILKYPTRIALNPFISTVGWNLPDLFSGSLIVASVLSLATIGPLLLTALMSQDMFMAGSIILILTALTLVGTLVSDILLAWIDPRVRIGMTGT